MDVLFPRQANSCSGSKQWYVCTAGSFRGCCSSDPCTRGVCPDDESVSSSSTTTSTPSSESSADTDSLTFWTTVNSRTGGAATITTESPTTSPTASTTDAKITSLVKPSTSAAAGTTTLTSSSAAGARSASHAGLIGGVVGGIAALVLCTLLIFCWRRKKRAKRFTLLRWQKSGSSQPHYDPDMAFNMKGDFSPSFNETSRLNDSSPNRPPSAPSATGSHTNPNTLHAESLPSSLSNTATNNNSARGLAIGAASVSSATLTSQSLRGLPVLPPIIPTSSEVFASIPSRVGLTPELPDTGFYRQRAELAPHSQSELINVPLDQRRRRNPLRRHSKLAGDEEKRKKKEKFSSSSSSSTSSRSRDSPAIPSSVASPSSCSISSANSPGLATRHTARRVVTADGVVLGANLDFFPGGPHSVFESQCQSQEQGQSRKTKNSECGSKNHVMSFMHYDSDVELGEGGFVGHAAVSSDRSAFQTAASGSSPALTMPTLEEQVSSPSGEALAANEAGGYSPEKDVKTPSGTIGLDVRGE
ncbi:hypothetical protein NUU61_000628 [Penicillium alfredii]|uniref:Uncharacterized protein n=1 Tax=Penicillium alfredii TaxID=1506179 RepID=A0A9W9KPX3_9EURO|nr:uncharacterized protein NUU61_000628 [Penicillium alfredii]KAJ5114869.1 hypothetical protein NUU61_000628 [Penicillium alfredii]